MKHLSLFFLFTCAYLTVLSQGKTFIVKGVVVDSASQQPLGGASVFAQNTTQGTTSNAEGIFAMRLPNGGYELIVSYTGYETRSVRISNAISADSIRVSLPQIDKAMAEVAVVATNEVEDGWQRFGSFFLENFVGTTANAAHCVIENPQTFRFFYTKNKKRHRLKVTANEDVIVRNNALGYIIRYQLDSFSYDYNSRISQYTGYPFFIEIDTTEEVKEQWVKNRARTYLGSRLHFMTAMYDSIVNDEGFIVEKLSDDSSASAPAALDNLYDSSIYQADSNSVNVFWNGRYRVSYRNVLPDKKFLQEFKLPANTRMQVTLLEVNDGFVIEENGFFYEQYDVINTGYWAWKKLAEALPYDYEFR
jgi:hypothetical protein